jgi:hypothetical protein
MPQHPLPWLNAFVTWSLAPKPEPANPFLSTRARANIRIGICLRARSPHGTSSRSATVWKPHGEGPDRRQSPVGADAIGGSTYASDPLSVAALELQERPLPCGEPQRSAWSQRRERPIHRRDDAHPVGPRVHDDLRGPLQAQVHDQRVLLAPAACELAHHRRHRRGDRPDQGPPGSCGSPAAGVGAVK